jgi:4-hydroxy-tetrahydrodipicolinate reductase
VNRVLVAGARGRIGRLVCAALRAADDLELVAEIEVDDDLAAAIESGKPDVAVDFTTPEAVFGNVSALLESRVHVVIGTSGLNRDQLNALGKLASKGGIACLHAPNFAIGAVLMMRFAQEAAQHFPWAEVVERHHEGKRDAPSGTARATAERIAAARSAAPKPERELETVPGARGGRVGDVPVHSLRLPGSLAHQEVYFGGPGETLVIRHDTSDRGVFVPGVLLAVRRIAGRTGLLDGLESVLWPDT